MNDTLCQLVQEEPSLANFALLDGGESGHDIYA